MGKLLIRKWSSFFLVLMLAVSVSMLTGCDGDDGAPGPPGVDGEPGAPGVPSTTNESCNVCHGAGAVADVAEVHPMLEKPTVSNIVVNRSAGEVLTVDFTVTDADGDGIEGIGDSDPWTATTESDLRVYMAAIVPAGTVTGNAPQATWENDYLEMWAEERGTEGQITDLGDGNYTFTMTATVADIGPGGDAPDAQITDKMRVYVRADARDFEGFDRTMGVADFDMPAAGGTTGVIDTTTRTIVTIEACTQCHGDPLEQAAHGGGYQSPQVCNMCHSPIGAIDEGDGDISGDLMQTSGFWLASLIHTIHQARDFTGTDIATGDWQDRSHADFSEVTYPRHPSDCGVCHFDDGQDAYADWTMPKAETCFTCHNTAENTAHYAAAGATDCNVCHNDGIAPTVETAHAVTTLKGDPAHEGNVVTNVHAYESTLTLTPPANAGDGDFYVAGEEILVTVTTDGVNAGEYNTEAGPFTAANVYVYGPRSNPVPILTPGSTTDLAMMTAVDGVDADGDPLCTEGDVDVGNGDGLCDQAEYDAGCCSLPADFVADQGRTMLAWIEDDDDNIVPNPDPQVLTDETGFQYQLQAIPADLASGTYMVMAYATDLTDCSAVYRGSVCIDGWVYTTFQVGEPEPKDPRVSGDCSGCHDPSDWTSFYHRSYFGTDGCIACHDQSGNHADPLANRVHAVHAASATGDLLGAAWDGSDPEIEAPTFPRNGYACEACHTSGNESYLGEPTGNFGWGVPCIGCHGDTDGSKDHMIQNGSDFSTWDDE